MIAAVIEFLAYGQAHAFAPNPEAYTGSDQFEEIVVTAQRRSEYLQDVPVTVNAISGETLTSAGITNIQDLSLVAPGIQVINLVGFANPYIRGVGAATTGPGIEAPVAIYVDNVYYASTSSSLLDFINVQDVQILKGPQGTLFGRNATGGLIQITTKEPTQKSEFDAGLTYGNYDSEKVNIYAGGGIADHLAADVAVQAGGMQSGYGTNLFNGDPVYGNDISLTVRSKWVWTPGDETKLTAIFDYAKQRNSNVGEALAPGTVYPTFLGVRSVSQSTPYNLNQDVQPLFANQNGGLSLKADQDAPFAHIANIIAYRQAHTQVNFDLDLSRVPFQSVYLTTDENQITDELAASSLPQNVIGWATGVYYIHSLGKYDPSLVTFPPPGSEFGVAPFSDLFTYGTQSAHSTAGYGQAWAPVAPHTTLTAGVRYTYEKHSFAATEPTYLPNGTIFANLANVHESQSFDAPSWRVSLDHHLPGDHLVYASFSTGFKSGGYNTQVPTDPAFFPEKLAAYEVGIKSHSFNRRITVDLSMFRYDFRDIQVEHIEGASDGIINGGRARLNGVDFDLAALVCADFTLHLTGEYLDNKYTLFPNAPIGNPDLAVVAPTVSGNAAGNSMPYSPRFAAMFSGTYKVHLADNSFDISVIGNGRSRESFEPDMILYSGGYIQLNTSIQWVPLNAKYDAILWSKNLTDRYVINHGGTYESGLHSVTYDPPRTYGVTLQYRF